MGEAVIDSLLIVPIPFETELCVPYGVCEGAIMVML